jgi:beta-barrel assembly-enhancing protease
MNHWKILTALIGVLGGCLSGCSTNPATGERELVLIPESQEVAMGLQAAPQFESQFGGAVSNSQVQAYVQGIGKKLAAVSDRQVPWEFKLVNSTTPNAFALPGGKVFVTAGLFKSLTNERQLAAVLGHEIGHVCAKHNVKGMQRQMGAQALTELAAKAVSPDKAEAAKTAAGVVGNMAVLKYSRDDEYMADSLGIKYMEKAGYNPWGMVETLEYLLKLGGTEAGKFQEMFQTHPLTSERVKNAKDQVSRTYPRYRPDESDPRAGDFRQIQAMLGK